MYSSGSIETGPDPFEGRDELVDKIRRCCALVTEDTPVVPILSSVSNVKLVVGNWTMTHKREGEVDIFNAEGTKVHTNASIANGSITKGNITNGSITNGL